VPGRAFTRDGRRIGRWSGYYDKLINQYPNSQTIGVCFRCQMFEKLPEDSWDKRMDEVVFPSINLE
jgi:5-formyltetrahydrofolate cyclo-ligase